MKTYLISALIGLLTFSSTIAQTINQLGPSVASSVSDQTGIEVLSDNQGIPYISYITNDQLLVRKLVNGSWQNTSSSFVDNNVRDFDICHNQTTNELVIAYTKGDGLYVRKYDGSAWTAAFYDSAVVNAYASTTVLTLNEQGNVAYILNNHNDQGTGTTAYLTFDFNTLTFGNFTVDNYYTPQMTLVSCDLQCDQETGNLYMAAYANMNIGLKRYDGTSWNFVTSSFPYTYAHRLKHGLTNTSPAIIISAQVLNSTAGFHYRLMSYNATTNASSTLEPIQTISTTGAADLTDVAISPVNNYAAFAINESNNPTATSLLKYYDGNDTYEISHSLGQNYIQDCYFDIDGNLLLATIQSGLLKVFMVDAFTTSVNTVEDDLNFTVYPNPSDDFVRISGKNMIGSRISISSLSGQVLLEVDVESIEDQIININQLSGGVYIVKCNYPNGRKVEKRLLKN